MTVVPGSGLALACEVAQRDVVARVVCGVVVAEVAQRTHRSTSSGELESEFEIDVRVKGYGMGAPGFCALRVDDPVLLRDLAAVSARCADLLDSYQYLAQCSGADVVDALTEPAFGIWLDASHRPWRHDVGVGWCRAEVDGSGIWSPADPGPEGGPYRRVRPRGGSRV